MPNIRAALVTTATALLLGSASPVVAQEIGRTPLPQRESASPPSTWKPAPPATAPVPVPDPQPEAGTPAAAPPARADLTPTVPTWGPGVFPGGRTPGGRAPNGPSAATQSGPPRTAIGVDVGFGSAVGALGITLTRAFGANLEIELGTGIGVSGYQLSVMPKLVLGEPRNHFVAGAGLSVAFPDNPANSRGHPIWLNVDAIGFEHINYHGIAFLAALGFTRGLGGGQLCTAGPFDSCGPKEGWVDVSTQFGPQFRVGIEYWF
jgi:hypothetical protein